MATRSPAMISTMPFWVGVATIPLSLALVPIICLAASARTHSPAAWAPTRSHFNLKTESPKGTNHDIITDFSGVGLDGDHINVHDIDANAQLGGNQNFHFIGAQHFHHHAGELHFLAARDFR